MSRALQKLTGRAILTAVPFYRRRLLRRWTEGGVSFGRLERWFFACLSRALDVAYYAPATSTTERERLKALCMADSSAIQWAHHYLKLGFPDAFTPHLAMFRWIEEALKTGRARSVHQVACCSGRETAYFAGRYPDVRFVGSDCDPMLVDFLNRHWADVPNLTFVTLDLVKFAKGAVDLDSCDLLYASGGFHYLDESSLRGVLAAARQGAGELHLSQPMDRVFDPVGATASAPRQQLSWNHPYPRMLEETGWTDVCFEEGLVESLPTLKNFAARGRRS